MYSRWNTNCQVSNHFANKSYPHFIVLWEFSRVFLEHSENISEYFANIPEMNGINLHRISRKCYRNLNNTLHSFLFPLQKVLLCFVCFRHVSFTLFMEIDGADGIKLKVEQMLYQLLICGVFPCFEVPGKVEMQIK